MEGYKVTVKEVSKELTAKERIAFKDTSNCVRLDEATQEGKVLINPIYYGILSIHNEKSDNVDYENYVIVADDGTKYVTGSQAFWTSFIDIAEEMAGETEEWGIEVFRMESKNYKGKDFLTCSII